MAGDPGFLIRLIPIILDRPTPDRVTSMAGDPGFLIRLIPIILDRPTPDRVTSMAGDPGFLLRFERSLLNLWKDRLI